MKKESNKSEGKSKSISGRGADVRSQECIDKIKRDHERNTPELYFTNSCNLNTIK